MSAFLSFFFLSLLLNSSGRSISDMCAFFCRSALEASPSSLQDAPPHIVPVRPPPGEKPAKGFTWEDYGGVQVDEDASSEEDGGWGVVRSRRSQLLLFSVLSESNRLKILSSLQDPTRLRRRVQEEQQVRLPPRRHHSHSRKPKSSARMRRDERC